MHFLSYCASPVEEEWEIIECHHFRRYLTFPCACVSIHRRFLLVKVSLIITIVIKLIYRPELEIYLFVAVFCRAELAPFIDVCLSVLKEALNSVHELVRPASASHKFLLRRRSFPSDL
jgi:hypothetical protein